MRIEARAKINWTLDVLGERPDGYHLLDMLMQSVSLADTVTCLPAETIRLTTSGFPRLRPTEDHLALRAARALKARTGYPGGAAIHVHKRIPVGAGMGGGSADAAAVLYGLNALWGTGLDADALAATGLTLGADVPFCLRGGLMRVGGIGDELTGVPCARPFWLVVVQPCRGLSTREVFAAWRAREDAVHPRTDRAQAALATGDLALLCGSVGNSLEAVSAEMRPQIGEATRALGELGAAAALMTGSGSAVFGVFASAPAARAAADALRGRWRKTFLCHTCGESLLVADQGAGSRIQSGASGF